MSENEDTLREDVRVLEMLRELDMRTIARIEEEHAKDYAVIAEVFKEHLDIHERNAEVYESEAGGFNAVRHLLYALADRLVEVNPRLDRMAFLTAATGVDHVDRGA